jgi:hypothetical protein
MQGDISARIWMDDDNFEYDFAKIIIETVRSNQTIKQEILDEVKNLLETQSHSKKSRSDRSSVQTNSPSDMITRMDAYKKDVNELLIKYSSEMTQQHEQSLDKLNYNNTKIIDHGNVIALLQRKCMDLENDMENKKHQIQSIIEGRYNIRPVVSESSTISTTLRDINAHLQSNDSDIQSLKNERANHSRWLTKLDERTVAMDKDLADVTNLKLRKRLTKIEDCCNWTVEGVKAHIDNIKAIEDKIEQKEQRINEKESTPTQSGVDATWVERRIEEKTTGLDITYSQMIEQQNNAIRSINAESQQNLNILKQQVTTIATHIDEVTKLSPYMNIMANTKDYIIANFLNQTLAMYNSSYVQL